MYIINTDYIFCTKIQLCPYTKKITHLPQIFASCTVTKKITGPNQLIRHSSFTTHRSSLAPPSKAG